MEQLTITLIIIIITGIISFTAFNNQKVIDDLIFYPPAITRHNQWYRFFTCGLIHADIVHLLFNMFSLYLLGEDVEKRFSDPDLFADKGKIFYILMYIMALFACLIPTFFKHKNDYYYKSLGASGAVSAVIFAGILLDPITPLGFFFLPPVIPGYIFGVLYLILTSYMQRRGTDNINHSAHFWGAIFGIAFVVGMAAILQTDYQPLEGFWQQIKMSLGI